MDAQGGGRAELQVFHIQPRNLRDPRAGVIHGGKHHSIPVTAPSRAVGSIEESGHLFAGNIRYRPPVKPFDRDGERTGDRSESGWILGCRIAEKRTEGGEAQIPASDAVVPLALQRVEKRENLGSVEISERQGGGRLSKPLLAELQK
jgi:hypothetical protein